MGGYSESAGKAEKQLTFYEKPMNKADKAT